MSERIWKLIRAILLNKRLLPAGFLLLTVILLDFLFLQKIVPELDTLEHFLFGFVLSEFASIIANSMARDELLSGRFGHDSRRTDLLVRLLGFFLIGGLLWEASERFVFPLFGPKPEPFFSLPITLKNIDGTIDVTVGALGCLLAWYLAKS
ncbi:MAG: hypothetical protein JSV57_00580 [Candidatus Bathyarchaeota archaeon]|nr:MAG: hypothetical protein JSV57_00580 [Candidatus Bathyarchaeota archaeon]